MGYSLAWSKAWSSNLQIVGSNPTALANQATDGCGKMVLPRRVKMGVRRPRTNEFDSRSCKTYDKTFPLGVL